MAARQAHNLKVGGSSPSSATHQRDHLTNVKWSLAYIYLNMLECPGAQASPPAKCYPMYTPLPPAKNHTVYSNYPHHPKNKLIRKYVLQHKIKTQTIIFYTKMQKNHTFSKKIKKNIVLLQPFLAHTKTFLPINNTINNQIFNSSLKI